MSQYEMIDFGLYLSTKNLNNFKSPPIIEMPILQQILLSLQLSYYEEHFENVIT
jgi:hypothetical protein